MSFNIDHVETLTSTLRISKKNAKKAEKLGLPEGNHLYALTFGEDGYSPVPRFQFSGEGSGHAFPELFRKFAALHEGDADLIMTWEGGEAHGGVRIRSGKMKECDVVMTLAPEVA